MRLTTTNGHRILRCSCLNKTKRDLSPSTPNHVIDRPEPNKQMSEPAPAGGGAALLHALHVLRALSGSRLTADERAGVVRSVVSVAGPSGAKAEGGGLTTAGIKALSSSDPEDTQRRVEASWLVLQERLRSGVVDPAEVKRSQSVCLAGRRLVSCCCCCCCCNA